MTVSSIRNVLIAVLVVGSAFLTGCGSDDVKLKEVPPVPIGAVKDEKATSSQETLKIGAPPKGSSSGMNHNPSETPRPSR